MENMDIFLEGYSTLLLWVEIIFITQPVVYQPKLWHLIFLVYKVSSAVFNIWLATHINPYFILLIIIMAQLSSDLHGVGIKFKTTQPRIFRMPWRCGSLYNSQHKTVSFRYSSYSSWCFCIMESTYSTIYSLWIHWWRN